MLTQEKQRLDSWISAAEKDAELKKRLPMIIFKFSYIGSYVVFDYRIIKLMMEYAQVLTLKITSYIVESG